MANTIQFPCRCGHRFNVDADDSGRSIQCPQCGLLNDVPGLGEKFADDGTYDISVPVSPAPQLASENRLAELTRTFSKDRYDSDGNEIDLRPTPQEIAAVGAPVPVPRAKPRYDPETGELIQPLEVKTPTAAQIDRSAIPLAKPALSYATADTPGISQPAPAQMMMPANIIVIASVLLIHIVTLSIMAFAASMGLFIAIPAMFIIQLMIVSHYGNVIDEIGPEQHDELPRFARNLSFYEDIWHPLMAMSAGTIVCYFPAFMCVLATIADTQTFLALSDCLLALVWIIVGCMIVIAMSGTPLKDISWTEQLIMPLMMMLFASFVIFGPAGLCVLLHASPQVTYAVAVLLALGGSLFLPAVLLTLVTSGALANVRPDRVVLTMRKIGPRYAVVVVAWLIGVVAYLFGQLFIVMAVGGAANPIGGPAWMHHPLLGFPLLLIGVLATHYFCFELGMFYRTYHGSFPWLYQRHISTRTPQRADAIRTATVRRRATNRVVQPPRRP
jgi:hypothetical protein